MKPRAPWAGKTCGECCYWPLHRESPYGEFEDGGKCRHPERRRLVTSSGLRLAGSVTLRGGDVLAENGNCCRLPGDKEA